MPRQSPMHDKGETEEPDDCRHSNPLASLGDMENDADISYQPPVLHSTAEADVGLSLSPLAIPIALDYPAEPPSGPPIATSAPATLPPVIPRNATSSPPKGAFSLLSLANRDISSPAPSLLSHQNQQSKPLATLASLSATQSTNKPLLSLSALSKASSSLASSKTPPSPRKGVQSKTPLLGSALVPSSSLPNPQARDSHPIPSTSPSLLAVLKSITNPTTNHPLVASSPSPTALFLSSSHVLTKPFAAPPLVSSLAPPTRLAQSSKANITPFHFQTQSPDDIVLSRNALAKTSIATKGNGSSALSRSDESAINPPKVIVKAPVHAPKSAGSFPKKSKEPPTTLAHSEGQSVPVAEKTPASSKKQEARDAEIRHAYAGRNASQTASDITLVIVGHVDSGKSTLLGHLLLDLGNIAPRTVEKYQSASTAMKKGSFAYAWVLDQSPEEREHGVTMDYAQTAFITPGKQRRVVVVDSPGHVDFVPNMISGASQADAALLVVDSSAGAFEAGFQGGGQTKDHILLCRSLGIGQLVVAVNKLELHQWSQQAFDAIQSQLMPFLLQAGFKAGNITWVPISGLSGENVSSRSKLDSLAFWYKGGCLLDLIDSLVPPKRNIIAPLRLSIADYFKAEPSSGLSGHCVCGRIEAGTICPGDKILLATNQEYAVIKAMQIAESRDLVRHAFCGDMVTLQLTGGDLNLRQGDILCSPESPIPMATRFTAKVVTFEGGDFTRPITIGMPVILHRLTLAEPATISTLVSVLDKKSGAWMSRPRVLPRGGGVSAIIQVTVQRPIPIEPVSDLCKGTGRFILRSGSHIVAAGIVQELSP